MPLPTTAEGENMNINKYVDFARIWAEEVDAENIADYTDDKATIEIVTMLCKDSDIELIPSECSVEEDKMILFCGEQGGNCEGDNVGWSRDYVLYLDFDFMITFAQYTQG